MPLDINSNIITSLGAKYLNDTSITTSGLTLHYDFGVASCYPGSGTSVTDLSPSGYAGTTVNSPSYSSTNGGGLVFNNSNTYIDIASSSNIISGTAPFSFDAFYTLTGRAGGEIFGNYGTSYNGLWISAMYGVYIGGTSYYFPGSPIANGTYHLGFTRASNGAVVTYKNGVSVTTGTNSTNLSLGINYRIGADVNVVAEPFGGSLYCLRLYNRALSATEMLQNFNAQRQRFGL
jgi:hypothetical protein